MINFSKQGVKRVNKTISGVKMMYFPNKDKKCKLFGFWAKIVKVAKVWALTEKHFSGRAETAKE